MGRKNFGKKKKNQQKKQKKSRKSSKGYPGIPQEEVTCREVAIYVPPDEESDQESDSYDDDDPRCYNGGCRCGNHGYGHNLDAFTRAVMYRFLEAMVISEMVEDLMMGRNRGGPSFGYSRRRARR